MTDKRIAELERSIQDILDTAITVDNNCREIKKVDQIITLIQPLIDKAFMEGVKKTTDACDSTYGEMLKEAVKAEREGWELQDSLLSLTVLNQNAPKIVLTNDEVG